MEVRLSPSEVMQAAMAGIMRQVQNIKAERKPAHGAGSDNDWQLNIEGALGEAALAKFLNRYWLGTGKLRGHDVGGLFDVRTGRGDGHRLIVHPGDPDDRIIYLLTGTNGDYVVRGWIRAGDAKQPQYWQDPSGKNRPAYFVPQSALNHPDQEP